MSAESGVADALEAAELERLARLFADSLATFSEEINGLNVYPVPDGDTGTNLRLTMESVRRALDGPDDVRRAIVHGSLMGARGNSGVIMSQVLRGLTEAVFDDGKLTCASLAKGLRSGAELAYAAVMKPQEGTILTVAREAAEEAEAAAESAEGLSAAAARVVARARDCLARTPEMLPVLKHAGVVDAGGRGLVLLLECLRNMLDGTPLPAPSVPTRTPAEAVAGAPGDTDEDRGSLEFKFEVQFLLEAPDQAAAAYRELLGTYGDCVLVVGGAGLYNVHVHTNDVGPVIEEAIGIGRPRQIDVTYLEGQVAEQHEASVLARMRGEAEPEGVGLVAVAAGEGILAILRSLGVRGLVPGGQTFNPSAQEIVAGIKRAGAAEVIVLPNNKNVVASARTAAEVAVSDGVVLRAEVVPTESPLQAFAALLAFDRDAPVSDNVEAMSAQAAATKHGEVAHAVRSTQTPAGHVQKGQCIGLWAGEVCAIGDDPQEAAMRVLEHMREEDDSLLTLVYGAEVDEWDAHELGKRAAEKFGLEVEVHRGGQPHYPYLIGLE
jgi:hypothetical protein